MKKLLIALFAVSLMTSSFAQSRTNSLRCGQKIVREGDSKSYVISVCGKPSSEDVIAEEKSGVRVIELVFNIGGKTKIVTFKANKVTTIKDI